VKQKELNVVIVSPEMVPFSKVGGLADVIGALPDKIEAKGCNITIFTPLYKSIDRKKDFTPINTENTSSKQFLGFIETELIPYIDKTYRTHPFRLLEGHSLGGLFTASTLLEKPEILQGFIIMSPAFWWNGVHQSN